MIVVLRTTEPYVFDKAALDRIKLAIEELNYYVERVEIIEVPELTDEPDMAACVECGHLHFDRNTVRYETCPLFREGCDCPMDDTLEVT